MRWWRLPDGLLLTAWPDSHLSTFLLFAGPLLVEQWRPRSADDCELLYVWGHRVDGDRLERVLVCDRGPGTSQPSVQVLEVKARGLTPVPEGALADVDQAAAAGAVAYGVERLYAALAQHPGPVGLRVCPCCRDASHYAHLLGTGLRELAAQSLADYVPKAMTTVGDAADFCYFVPRLLELFVVGASDGWDVEMVFDKIRLSGWDRWPSVQRAAVWDLLDAYWTLLLTRYPAPYSADEVLYGLGVLGPELTGFLSRWQELAGEAAALHLRDFVAGNSGELAYRDRLANAFWHGHRDREALVARWLRSPVLSDAVVDGFVRAGSVVAADALDEAERCLRAFSRS